MATVDFAVNPGEQRIQTLMDWLGCDRKKAVKLYLDQRAEDFHFRMLTLGEQLREMVTAPYKISWLCGECLQFHGSQISCGECEELIFADSQMGPPLWDLV